MITTAEHIAAIREALEAGPTPGEWHNSGGYLTTRDPEKASFRHSIYHLDEIGHDGTSRPFQAIPFSRNVDAAFIASCNPVAMTAVLADIDRIKAENERMREALEFYDCHGPALCDCAEGNEDKDNVCCGFRARAALKGDTHGN